MFLRGVNLTGGEIDYGSVNTTNPVSGTDYLFVSNRDIDYLVSKKITFARLVISWEALQQSLNQPFTVSDYYNNLKSRVDYLTSKGVTVMLEVHGGSDSNFARYKKQVVGSIGFPTASFADFFSRLAGVYKSNSKVVFGLVNEPCNIGTMQWYAAAQATITAIRATGATNTIMVPGNGYTASDSWNDTWYDTSTTKISNAVGWLTLSDPLNNLVCSVHMYLDANNGGGADDIVSATIGVERLAKVVNWARANGKKVHLSEIGANSSNPLAKTAIDNVMKYIDANKDVLVGFAWWAYGPPSWWENYRFTLCPTNNYATDNVKMSWISPYLFDTASTSTGPTMTYLPTTYDANGFFHLDSGTSTYVGYRPGTYSDVKPIQLFVWMHGCGGTAEGDVWSIAPYATRSNQNYIAISIGGRDGDCWTMSTDVAKVMAAITDVSKHFNIDPRRIYLGGYSSGGDLAYCTAFYNAGIFAGVLAENTSPFRDTGSTQATSITAASWKFNVAHVAHLQDGTYPIAGVRTETDAMKAAGFPITRIEKTGTHWDADTATSGTNYDLINSLLPYLKAGWTSPDAVVVTPPAPTPTPTPAPAPAPTVTNITATKSIYKAPGDQGFTSSKTALGDKVVPDGTYTITAATRTATSDDNSVTVQIILYHNSATMDLTWGSMTIDLRGHTLGGSWDCTTTGTTGVITVTPTATNKIITAGNKTSFGFYFTRSATVANKNYQVIVKSIKW